VVIEHNNGQSDEEHFSWQHADIAVLYVPQRINSFPPFFCSAIDQRTSNSTIGVEIDKFRARLLQVVFLNTNEGYAKRQTTGRKGEKAQQEIEADCACL